MDRLHQLSKLEDCRNKVAIVHIAANANLEINGYALDGVELLLFEVLADLGTVIETISRS